MNTEIKLTKQDKKNIQEDDIFLKVISKLTKENQEIVFDYLTNQHRQYENRVREAMTDVVKEHIGERLPVSFVMVELSTKLGIAEK